MHVTFKRSQFSTPSHFPLFSSMSILILSTILGKFMKALSLYLFNLFYQHLFLLLELRKRGMISLAHSPLFDLSKSFLICLHIRGIFQWKGPPSHEWLHHHLNFSKKYTFYIKKLVQQDVTCDGTIFNLSFLRLYIRL